MFNNKIKDLEALNDKKSAEIARLDQKFSEHLAQGSQQA
jgi:hypothetical protein